MCRKGSSNPIILVSFSKLPEIMLTITGIKLNTHYNNCLFLIGFDCHDTLKNLSTDYAQDIWMKFGTQAIL